MPDTKDLTYKPLAQSSLELSDILAKEAVYCAVGRCSYSLKGAIPFQQCLDQYFIADVRNPDPKLVYRNCLTVV